MPFRRCRFYLDDGTPTKGGCHREATGECPFIHPSDPNWRDAPESNSTSNRAPPRGGANGDSTSAWNTTNWYTDTGGGSAPATSSMTGANRTPVATTGPGAGWGRAARTAAAPPSSSFSNSGTGGWGKSGGEARPIWGDSGGAGAGAGAGGAGVSTSPSTGNTAGWDDAPGWGDGGGWGSGTDAASGWGVGAGRAESATLAEPPAGSSRAGNPPTAPRKDRPTPSKDRAGTAINLPPKPAWEWGKTSGDMVYDDVASTTSSARSKVGTNKTASGVSSADLQPPQPVAAANSKPVSQEPPAISTQSSHDRIRITIPDTAVQGRTRSASTKSALISPVAEFSPLDNAGMPPSNATEDIANATTPKQSVPLTDIHVLRTLLRAAQIRQDRDESGRQYEQWKVAQRSRTFVSVGRAARDELDRRAAELKQNYKAEEKLLATLIDTLAKTPENAQYLAMAPAISEVRRLAEDSKEWLDLVRPHMFVMSGLDPSKEGRPASPPPLPPSFPSSVPLPSSTAGGDVEMLEDNEVVEAEMGEILPEKPRRPSSSGQISGQKPPGRNLAEQFQTRLQVLEDRFDEFEVNHPSASSIDVDQLLKGALEARALEEGKFRESARTAREATLEALRTKYELLNSKLQEVAKESQGLRNKLQGTQTELASWRTEVDRLKARDSESTLRLEQLGTAIEQGQQDIAQKTNKLQELHLTHNRQQQQQQQDKEPPLVTPQLLGQVQSALQARLQNDMRASANAMRESVLKHVHACDERLFTDLLKRLQPTLAITNAVFRRLDGDPTTDKQ